MNSKFKEGTIFESGLSGNRFVVLSVKKAILNNAYNVTVRNLETGRKSVHGLKYLEKADIKILEE